MHFPLKERRALFLRGARIRSPSPLVSLRRRVSYRPYSAIIPKSQTKPEEQRQIFISTGRCTIRRRYATLSFGFQRFSLSIRD